MKKFLITLLSIALLLYGLAWGSSFYLYTNFAQNISNDAGEKPNVTGFPFAPHLTFAGTYTLKNGTRISSPAITVRGFLLPAQRILINADKGLTYTAHNWGADVMLDTLSLQFQIPMNIPKTNLKSDWHYWQSNGGKIIIDHLTATAGEFSFAGKEGMLTLSPTLDWQGEITTRLTGTNAFIMGLADKKIIPSKAALMAQSFLGFLTRKDETTGADYILTGVQVRANKIFIGPFPIEDLPKPNLK